MLTEAGLSGPGFCRAYADVVDQWLAQLMGDEKDVALIAVGGYEHHRGSPARSWLGGVGGRTAGLEPAGMLPTDAPTSWPTLV